jgi:hypothetical protein
VSAAVAGSAIAQRTSARNAFIVLPLRGWAPMGVRRRMDG